MRPNQVARLSTGVANSLRSNVIIRSLGQAVEECVQNSIDAEASVIFVEVDFSTLEVRVEDNGYGIDRQGLSLVGTRYCTSKLRTMDELHTTGVPTLGFRGEALSSISNTAAVSIQTRPRGQFETFYKVLKNGETVSSGVSSEHRAGCGTTVVLRDFLENDPVRRSSALSSKHKLTLDIKTRVLRVLFVHPGVQLRVTDSSTKAQLLHSMGTGSSLDVIGKTFGPRIQASLQELNHTAGSDASRITVSGYASGYSSGHSSRELQYLYINRRPITCCSLYKLINCFFVAELSVGANLGKDTQPSVTRESGVARQAAVCSPSLGKRGAIRSERIAVGSRAATQHAGMCRLYPIFFINVELPASKYDITYTVDKSHAEFRNQDEVSGVVKQALRMLWRPSAAPLPSHQLPHSPTQDGARGLSRTNSSTQSTLAQVGIPNDRGHHATMANEIEETGYAPCSSELRTGGGSFHSPLHQTTAVHQQLSSPTPFEMPSCAVQPPGTSRQPASSVFWDNDQLLIDRDEMVGLGRSFSLTPSPPSKRSFACLSATNHAEQTLSRRTLHWADAERGIRETDWSTNVAERTGHWTDGSDATEAEFSNLPVADVTGRAATRVIETGPQQLSARQHQHGSPMQVPSSSSALMLPSPSQSYHAPRNQQVDCDANLQIPHESTAAANAQAPFRDATLAQGYGVRSTGLPSIQEGHQASGASEMVRPLATPQRTNGAPVRTCYDEWKVKITAATPGPVLVYHGMWRYLLYDDASTPSSFHVPHPRPLFQYTS